VTWLSVLAAVEPVNSKRRRLLPLSLLEKRVESIIRTRSNSICHFHCLVGNSAIIFQQSLSLFSVCAVFISSRSSTVRGVVFTRRVTSLMTYIKFWLFSKEYLTSRYKFCIDWQTVIFSQHFGENRVILLQIVAK